MGTVVAERVIDLVFLITLIAVAFVSELDTLMAFFESEEFKAISSQDNGGGGMSYLWVGAVVFIAAIISLGVYVYRTRRFFTLRILSKTRQVWQGLKSGLMSVFRLEKRILFILYSVAIWVLYYLMMYFVMLAFPETDQLTLLQALTIFVIGGIAMAIPLPGGAGSFHVLVPLGLVMISGLAENKAGAFTFIFHGWQTIVIIVVGLLSLIGSQMARSRNA